MCLFVGVGGSIVPDVVGTSVGSVGFDVGPIQSPTWDLHLLILI